MGDKVPKDNLGIKRKMTNCTFGYNGIVHEILRHSFLVSISQYVYNKHSFSFYGPCILEGEQIVLNSCERETTAYLCKIGLIK